MSPKIFEYSESYHSTQSRLQIVQSVIDDRQISDHHLEENSGSSSQITPGIIIKRGGPKQDVIRFINTRSAIQI